ncbi:MAG: EAL domain-containing protein [Actinomycetota bacterium]|nr:EAL domain-containing protein [Actinomycetota bacterium]
MRLSTGRVVGFEALARWKHPERGLISPIEFVPLAEENGLIVPIGRGVLGEACRRAKGWQGLRPAGKPPLIIAVNLSARQLSHPGLTADVGEALAETGLEPELLTLEVTESVLVDEAGRHADALRSLRNLGVRLAIDDFGTGYSSLSYLKRLPASVLKLDGSFVEGIGEGAEEDEVLLPGVIGIAHGLGLTVCAEGVETAGQEARLRELGCDLAQGNHFSRPLPGEEASRLLSDP